MSDLEIREHIMKKVTVFYWNSSIYDYVYDIVDLAEGVGGGAHCSTVQCIRNLCYKSHVIGGEAIRSNGLTPYHMYTGHIWKRKLTVLLG